MTRADLGLCRQGGVITHKIYDKKLKMFVEVPERQNTLKDVLIHVDWETYRNHSDLKQIRCRARGSTIPKVRPM